MRQPQRLRTDLRNWAALQLVVHPGPFLLGAAMGVPAGILILAITVTEPLMLPVALVALAAFGGALMWLAGGK